LKVEERLQLVNRPARLGRRQRQRPRRPAEAHRRALDHPSAAGPDFDRAPVLVGEIEVDGPGMLGQPDVDGSLRPSNCARASKIVAGLAAIPVAW
jgi:hypothetical protein